MGVFLTLDELKAWLLRVYVLLRFERAGHPKYKELVADNARSIRTS